MIIGYSVQGSTDRAVIHGLAKRWCPKAVVLEGHFRGSTKESLRREYLRICEELEERSVDVIVFLTDADTESWQVVKKNELSKFPSQFLGKSIHGVADRNIEAWLCADADWMGKKLGVDPASLRCDDPKAAFEKAIHLDRDDHKEAEIAAIVAEAPLRNWLNNKSFEDFYENARDVSQQRGCVVENLREKKAI